MPRPSMFLVSLIALALSASSLSASGSYSGQSVRPPAGIDADRYAVGKELFHGRMELPDPDPATEADQRQVLVAVQENLPSKARKAADLPPMAGRLADAQLESLLYFVKIRYKVDP